MTREEEQKMMDSFFETRGFDKPAEDWVLFPELGEDEDEGDEDE